MTFKRKNKHNAFSNEVLENNLLYRILLSCNKNSSNFPQTYQNLESITLPSYAFQSTIPNRALQ